MKRVIQIDREFSHLTIPYTEEEQESLERSLMREGCLEPIITWRGVILDGHKRYKFCGFEDIDYEIRELEFDSREEAVIWICRERAKGLDIHSPMFRYLIGKWYLCKKQINKELRRNSDLPQSPDYEKKRRNSIWDTSSRLAEEVGIHHSTIERNGAYAIALDRIANKEPMLFDAILSGEVKLFHKDVIAMSSMDEKELGKIRRKQLGKTDVKMRRRNKWDARDTTGGERMEEAIQLKTGIKEMPAFDPDMEIKGLSLTIPTWINAIARAEKKTDMDIATDKAKEMLTANLTRLQDQISRTLEVLTCTRTEH